MIGGRWRSAGSVRDITTKESYESWTTFVWAFVTAIAYFYVRVWIISSYYLLVTIFQTPVNKVY